MQIKFIPFFFVLLIVACAVNNKNQPINDPQEETQIKQVIETYFDGWRTGDTTKLGRAMHTTCQLKNINADGIDGVIIYDRA